jgi:uncharacterized lipoprotein YehR (DUF1307 family)
MNKGLKVLITVFAIVFAIMLCGCEDNNGGDTVLPSSSIESLTTSLLTIKGDNIAGILIKDAIGNIIDYNNNSDERVFVDYLDTEYKEIDDLNNVVSLLDDDGLYNVTVEYDGKNLARGIVVISNAPIVPEEDLIIIDEIEEENE